MLRFLRPHPENAIRIIGALWLLQGLNSLATTTASFSHGHSPNIDLSIAGLWVGYALLRHRWLAYKVALIATGIGIAIGGVLSVLLSFDRRALHQVTMFGTPSGELSTTVLLVAIVPLLLCSVWELWTLRRQDVRALFTRSAARSPSDVRQSVV